MSDLNSNIATTTLNVNTLSTASERQRLAEWMKIHHATHFKFKDLGRLKVEG